MEAKAAALERQVQAQRLQGKAEARKRDRERRRRVAEAEKKVSGILGPAVMIPGGVHTLRHGPWVQMQQAQRAISLQKGAPGEDDGYQEGADLVQEMGPEAELEAFLRQHQWPVDDDEEKVAALTSTIDEMPQGPDGDPRHHRGGPKGMQRGRGPQGAPGRRPAQAPARGAPFEPHHRGGRPESRGSGGSRPESRGSQQSASRPMNAQAQDPSAPGRRFHSPLRSPRRDERPM